MNRATRLSPRVAAAATATILMLLGTCGPAAAVSDPLGIWTLSMPGTPRSCRMQFRDDAAATGQAIAMPPGCRRAFPILAPVRSWSVPDGTHLALNDENGVNVLMFGEAGDGRLQAAGPESEAAYVLTSLKPRHDADMTPPAAPSDMAPGAVPSGAPAEAAGAARAPDPMAMPAPAPATVPATAGHYAVMRGSRDTGCMVTLDEAGRNTQASLKARLAPACRDQGIIVFDPIGWTLKGGRLVLEARKGHTAIFTQEQAGLWVKDARSGQPLGLKRL